MQPEKVDGTTGRWRDGPVIVSSMQALTVGQPCGVIHRLSTGEHGFFALSKVDGTGGRSLWGVPSTASRRLTKMVQKLSTGGWYGR